MDLGLNIPRMTPRTLAMVLAGGAGTRLDPLTRERAKPAVPFGGRYRIIDFCLSNFANSGIYKQKILTQYKSDSLNNHIARGWRLSAMLDQYVEAVPAQQRTGCHWFRGSADAIPEPDRAGRRVSEIVGADGSQAPTVSSDEPVGDLLANVDLRRLGGLPALDSDGRLAGIVTVEQVGRALRDAAA